jgi:hypothetical protein
MASVSRAAWERRRRSPNPRKRSTYGAASGAVINWASAPHPLEAQAALLEDGLQFPQCLLYLLRGGFQHPGQLPDRYRFVGHEQQGLHQYGQTVCFGHSGGG